MKPSKITVKDAESEYALKGYSVRLWCRTGHIQSEKKGNGYLIDRASLEAYIAKKGVQANVQEPVPRVSTLIDSTPVSPKDAQQNIQSDVQPAQAAIVDKPSATPDLWAADQPTAKAPAKTEESQPVQPSAIHSKQAKSVEIKYQPKLLAREEKKRFKKGPVRYAKDAMRHLDIAQLWDVFHWVQNRIRSQGTKCAA